MLGPDSVSIRLTDEQNSTAIRGKHLAFGIPQESPYENP